MNRIPDTPAPPQADSNPQPGPLSGVHILSLALNLPGPAALMRCVDLGATCIKLEPPPPPGPPGASADAMRRFSPEAYDALHQGVQCLQADLKSPQGQAVLQQELARADVLLTSFRPAALVRLNLGWDVLHAQHPQLCMVAIVGAPAPGADAPGHDLTYQAGCGLVPGLELPATLAADMAGALMASEAVLAALLQRQRADAGVRVEVALSEAARFVALPRQWGLTTPGGTVGGSHAGYRLYACADGRVAVAALEPHFTLRLLDWAGVADAQNASPFSSGVHAAMAQFFADMDCESLQRAALERDLPLLCMPDVAT